MRAALGQSNRPQPDCLRLAIYNPPEAGAGICGCARRLSSTVQRRVGLSGFWRDTTLLLATLAPHPEASVLEECLPDSVTGARCCKIPRCCHSLTPQHPPRPLHFTSLAYFKRHRHCNLAFSRSIFIVSQRCRRMALTGESVSGSTPFARQQTNHSIREPRRGTPQHAYCAVFRARQNIITDRRAVF